MKKSVVFCFICIILVISLVYSFSNINKFDSKIIENESDNKVLMNTNALTLMYETLPDSGEYQVSTNSEWPQDGYVFNEQLSGCENGSILSWDDESKRILMQVNASDKCYIYFDMLNDNGVAAELILMHNEVNDYVPDFSKIATTDEGLFATTGDLGTSYYFRGAVTDNYVLFNGYYWRIIRINGDNSIRMIYDGTRAHNNGSSSSNRTLSDTSNFADTYSVTHSCIGYMVSQEMATCYNYPIGWTGFTTINSSIKSVIDNWFSGTFSHLSVVGNVLNYLEDVVYCNDVDEADEQYYEAYERLGIFKNPTLICGFLSGRYSVESDIGNGYLDYPIGLITADEVAMAGGVVGVNNTDYYLYTGNTYYTMTPAKLEYEDPIHHTTSSINSLFVVDSQGQLIDVPADYNEYVRPVITLKSDTIFEGFGTIDVPYKVVS